MQGQDAQAILWVTESGDPPELPEEFPPLEQLGVEICAAAQLDGCLRRLSSQGSSPTAVVIGTDTSAPLRLARQVYRLAPLTHMLFPVEPERLRQFRQEMSIAPMIGTYWSIVDPQPDVFVSALEAATRASRQRRQLRTSLDQINLRLSEERPPRDSDEYRKLVISDKYLATILEHAEDAIISLDSKRRIASWNTGAAEIFELSAEQATNVRLEELVVPEQSRTALSWFDDASRGHAVVQRELRFRRGETAEFIAEVTFAPIHSDQGEVIAVSMTARDITKRKRDEEELNRIRIELEDRVAERTAALETVNRELEAFTYSASHDLRAPLRGIDGFSQALLEDYGDALDETAGRYIERIRAGARKMGTTIDSLLLLSRISQAELHKSRVNLGQLTNEILEELLEIEPDREVDLRLEDGLLVQADPQLIRIALENLLSNSLKFSREREIAVIEVGRHSEGNEDVYFIRDNGVGFDMTYGDKLFLPFQRLHHPQRFEGTGIGLGTVQRVIARHSGRVWAESTPERGATFYFTLPADKQEWPLADVDRASGS